MPQLMEGQGLQLGGLAGLPHEPGLVTVPPGAPQVRPDPALNLIPLEDQFPGGAPRGQLLVRLVTSKGPSSGVIHALARASSRWRPFTPRRFPSSK
jgi:hypothetical protein